MPAPSEEFLPVGDLTELTNVIQDDLLMVQTSGANGDVMLVAISSIISRVLDSIYATLASPEFTGTPQVPDIADPTDDSQQIANTGFVQAVAALKADIASPSFTGQAHFGDHVPTTEDGNGDTVALATQDDIANLQTSIDSLTASINSLSSAITGLATYLQFNSKATFKTTTASAYSAGKYGFLFRAQAGWISDMVPGGSGGNGVSLGWMNWVGANTIHGVYMCGGHLYRFTWDATTQTFTPTQIS